MKQIPLDIGIDTAGSFETFIAGANGAAVAHLRQLAAPSPPVYLWGEAGAGKSHLLHAAARLCREHGGRVAWFDAGTRPPWQPERAPSLIVLDQCDQFDAGQQQAAFSLFVEAVPLGTPILGAGRLPPVDLPLRDDLRSRLGWGLVFALQPLSEAEARAALRREADRRGLFLGDEVMNYLLTHFERDLKHLVARLDQLDAYALVHKRAITLPLLRQMLAEKSETE